MSHNEGKAYNISCFAFSQRKRIGCDQSLNQLRSSGLGYRAEDKWGLRSKNPFYPEMQSKWHTGVMFGSWSDTDTEVWGFWTQQSRLGFWFSSPWPSPRPVNYFVMFYQHCQGLSRGVGQEEESYLSSQRPGASNYYCQRWPCLRSQKSSDRSRRTCHSSESCSCISPPGVHYTLLLSF